MYCSKLNVLLLRLTSILLSPNSVSSMLESVLFLDLFSVDNEEICNQEQKSYQDSAAQAITIKRSACV